tara:strand:- start:309 stop:635 length:327 start_codon:yes stop_codon:yes gene_type:complete
LLPVAVVVAQNVAAVALLAVLEKVKFLLILIQLHQYQLQAVLQFQHKLIQLQSVQEEAMVFLGHQTVTVPQVQIQYSVQLHQQVAEALAAVIKMVQQVALVAALVVIV